MLRWLKRVLARGAPPARIEVVTVSPPASDPPPRGDDPLAGVVAAIAVARTDIYARVAEANSLTEKEVMSAAEGLSAVVACASRNRDETARIVEMVDGGHAREGLARSLSRMSVHVDNHVGKLVADAQAQEGAAQRAQASTASLIKASRHIEGMLQAARMLALNARIEASRASTQERAFAVVADEIRNLSDVIAKTNAMMQELADSLSKTVGALLEQAQETRRGAEKFAEAARTELDGVNAEAAEFQRHAGRAMSVSETGMAEIVRASQAALSSLQFQDVVAQGLMRIDQRLHALHIEVAERAEDPDLVDGVAPVAHVEMGGDKAIRRPGAGDVTLF
jgi:methyl-accepting chemotaxis protein